MPTHDLFEVLRRRKEKYGFYIDARGRIRENKTESCPLCAAASQLGFGPYDNSNYDLAADAIGLDPNTAINVVDAVDYGQTEHQDLRAELRKTLGL